MKKGDKLGRIELIMIGSAAAAAAAVSVLLSMPGTAGDHRTLVNVPEIRSIADTAAAQSGSKENAQETDASVPSAPEPSVPVTDNTTETDHVSATAETFLYLDINTASAQELAELPGIGDVLAGAIISYRQAHGRFLNPEEIMEVSGIGEGIFSGIREHIYVTDPVYTAHTPPAPESPEVPKVPDIPEAAPAAESTEEETQPDYPVNINTADMQALMTLPGVDEELAGSIIRLREDIGGFTNTYELLLVSGMTQSHAAELVPLTVTGLEETSEQPPDHQS